jgi:[acyl-carrier-protein] S-malonyltransferase
MKPAQEKLAVDLEATTFGELEIPLVNNVEAVVVRTGEAARKGLYEQVPGSVRWTDTVRMLAGLGVTRTIEVGPGKVLSGLVRNIEPGIATANFGEPRDWDGIVAG